MQVALYARVSTPNQQQESTIRSQIQLLKQHIQQQQWALLPEHEFKDDGVSGARLDRPALDRLRDCAGRGEFDAVVILAPDRLAREYAHQWLLVEEFHKLNITLVFLQNPFGDTPQGKLLTQMQGMIAEYERAQILERTRRGRLEKARRGEFMPWAYHCYGYRYLPKHFGALPQVMIEPTEAEVVRGLYRALVEEQLSCRQITKRLNEAKTPTPSGKNQVWQPATVRNILTNQTYAGTARYNHRQPVLPHYRKTDESRLRDLKTGRSYRAESEWVLTEAPALITPELFEKAQVQLQRNADVARKMYQPASRRYLLRTLVKCGACGLGMVSIRLRSKCQKYEYLYYECKGHAPLTVGRTTRCQARTVRADRLDEVVWQAVTQLLQKPEVMPQLHQQWATAKSQNLSGLEAQQMQLQQRCTRLERQDQRLLDAYQSDAINLAELQARRQKLATERQQIEQEMRTLAETRQQTVHWQAVIGNAETFRRLLGDNLTRLSFEERQTVAQCLIKKVIVTGEDVDIHFVLPFELTPQAIPHAAKESEGTPGNFYRLRLADFNSPTPVVPIDQRTRADTGRSVAQQAPTRHQCVIRQTHFAHDQTQRQWRTGYHATTLYRFLIRRTGESDRGFSHEQRGYDARVPLDRVRRAQSQRLCDDRQALRPALPLYFMAFIAAHQKGFTVRVPSPQMRRRVGGAINDVAQRQAPLLRAQVLHRRSNRVQIAQYRDAFRHARGVTTLRRPPVQTEWTQRCAIPVAQQQRGFQRVAGAFSQRHLIGLTGVRGVTHFRPIVRHQPPVGAMLFEQLLSAREQGLAQAGQGDFFIVEKAPQALRAAKGFARLGQSTQACRQNLCRA